MDLLKIRYICILLVLLLLVSGCTSGMEKKLEDAKALVLQGEYAEAEELYLEILEKYKNKDLPKLKLGQFYLYRHDLLQAEKYLIEVEKESSDLAINLVRLAADSNNKELLDQTFNQYKDKEVVETSPIFFEDLIFAYGKFKEGEKIEEIINKLDQLKLSISPQAIEKAYSLFRDQDMEKLANSLIEKDIYNREVADLSLIPEIILETENREFINLTSGYFLSPDRLDLALLYGLDYDEAYGEVEIVLVNGLNGQVISVYKEDASYARMSLKSFDPSGYDEHILALEGQGADQDKPSKVELYDFVDDELERLDYEKESDLEINFKDNFEYEISSEKLGISYLMQLNLEDLPYYIAEEIYSQNGKLLDVDSLGISYENHCIESNLSTGDYICTSMELMDNKENNSFLVNILAYFKYEENKIFLRDLYVKNALGKEKAQDYKKVAGYKEIDFSDLATREEKLEKYLDFYLKLFKETENTIRTEYGKPLVEDYYGVRYLKYDDFIVFTNPSNPNDFLTSVWTSDLLGLDNDIEEVIKKFGPPENSGYDEEEMESYMDYRIDGYNISFTDIGKQHPYIKIKAIEN